MHGFAGQQWFGDWGLRWMHLTQLKAGCLLKLPYRMKPYRTNSILTHLNLKLMFVADRMWKFLKVLTADL